MNANKAYWALRAGQADLYDMVPLTRWIRPWPQWNPIWTHRAIIESCKRSWDDNGPVSAGVWSDHLRATRKKLAARWDTTVFGRGHSNKSFTHYLTICCLDAAVGEKRIEPFRKLIAIYQELAPDGCWREGIHYGLFCYDAIRRAWDLLTGVWPHHQRAGLTRCFQAHQEWLAVTKNHAGIWPTVGDGWPEDEEKLWIDIPVPRKFNAEEPIVIIYGDMTIHRNKDWVVIQNHRRSGPCYHEHCEGDGILVSYKGEWVLPGDGCPTWFRKVLAPWKWDRPKNHWGTVRKWDWPVLWRLRNRRAAVSTRRVALWRDRVVVEDWVGKNKIQWPSPDQTQTSNSIRFGFNPFTEKDFMDWKWGDLGVHVEGAIPDTKITRANVTTGYKESKQMPAVRISGQRLSTAIWALDSVVAKDEFDPDGWVASSG